MVENMKRKLKVICLALSILFAVLGVACNPGATENSSTEEVSTDWEEKEMNCNVSANSYTDIASLTTQEEINAYNKETKTALPCENGVIKSPYFELRINGRKIPVYAARTTNGIHSFAYIDVEKQIKDDPFALNVELGFLQLCTVLDDYGKKTKIF